MNIKKNLITLWQAFSHPRVFIFILVGTAIIFLTFLTSSNALEIAISGIASVFIGIGVNNLSSFETHLKDEQKLRRKIDHAIKIMEMTKSNINKLGHVVNETSGTGIKEELASLERFINRSLLLLKKDRALK